MNAMTPAGSAPAGTNPRFESLSEFQNRHTELVKTVGPDVLAPNNIQPLDEFLRRAVATGSVLDAPGDRSVAQGLINFWIARMSAALRALPKETQPARNIKRFEDALLNEFDPNTIRQVIDNAESWLTQPPAMDREGLDNEGLARRIALRLVRLQEDDAFVMRTTVQDVCEGLEPRRDAERVLADLVRLGVVQVSRNAVDSEEVALRFPELMTQWPRFQEWMGRRLEFRQRANDWAKRHDTKAAGVPATRVFRRAKNAFRVWALKAGALIGAKWSALRRWIKPHGPSHEPLSTEIYEEAEAYRDRNQAELRLTYEQRELEKQFEEWRQIRTVGAVALAVVFAALAILIFMLEDARVSEKDKAVDALKDKNAALKRESEAQKEASDLREKVVTAESNAERLQDLMDLAKTSMPRSPQKSLLLSVETLRASKRLIGELRGQQSSAVLNNVKSDAEELLRKTLINMGGLGYFADIGAITQLAAVEKPRNADTNAEKSELHWLAAAGNRGLIALWDFTKPQAPKQTVLRFGYEPQVRKLIFAGDGSHLIALNNQNVSIWDLGSPAEKFYFFQFPHAATAVANSTGTCLAVDDNVSKGHFIFIGKDHDKPKVVNWNLDAFEGRQNWRTLRIHCFSKDERWFACLTDKGDVLIWDLKALAASTDGTKHPPILLRGTSGNGLPANGAFLENGTGIVVFFGDGWARYWASKNGRWNALEPANEVDLLKAAGMGNLRKTFEKTIIKPWHLTANKNGTHAVMTLRVNPAPIQEAFCFTIEDVVSSTAKPRRLRRFEDSAPTGGFESDDSGRFLFAVAPSFPYSDRQIFRIWDLATADKDDSATDPHEVVIPFPERYYDVKPVPQFSSVVLRGNQNFVRWLNLSSPQPETLVLRGHDGNVTAHAYSQEGRWLVTGCEHGTIRAWNLNPLSPSAEPVVLRAASARNIALTPRMLVISLPDGAMRFLGIKNGGFMEEPTRFPAEKGLNEAARLYPSEDGQWLLERHVRSEIAVIWSLKNGIPERNGKLRLPEFEINEDAKNAPTSDDRPNAVAKQLSRILASANGDWLAFQGKVESRASVALWNLKGLNKNVPLGITQQISGELVGFDSSGEHILVTTDTELQTWRLGRTQEPESGYKPGGTIRLAQISSDKSRCLLAVVAEGKGRAELRDIGSKPASFPDLAGNFGKEDYVFLSEDGKLAWTVPEGDALGRYWDLMSGDRSRVTPNEFRVDKSNDGREARFITQSRDQRWLVTQENGEGFLWKLSGRVDKGQLKPDRRLMRVESAVFSADSSSLVTSGGGMIRAFRLETAVQTPYEVGGWELEFKVVSAALASEDVKPMLAVVCKVNNDYLLRVWDLAAIKGPKLILADSILSRPTEMMFRRDGSRLYLFFNKMIRVIDLNMDTLLEQKANLTVGRNLSEQEWPTKQLKTFRKTFPDLPVPAGIAPQKMFVGKLEGRLEKCRDDIIDKLDDLPLKPGLKEKTFKEYQQDMEAGASYFVEMRSKDLDSYLFLYGPDGREVAHDDDSGGFPDALIRYKCKVSGKYKIVATSFDGGGGAFRIGVSKVPRIATDPQSLDLRGQSKFAVSGKVSEEDGETGEGPGVAYDLLIPAGKICQIEASSSSFEPMLRIETAKDGGQTNVVGSDGGARLVFNTPIDGGLAHATYRVIVIGVRGKAGRFDLSVEIR